MFSFEDEQNRNVTTFIYGRYRFEEKVKSLMDNKTISEGDIFKASTIHGTLIYVTIVDWKPYKKFSYHEQKSSREEVELSPADRTDFEFIEHPEGIIIKITRREKADMNKRRAKGLLGLIDHLWVKKNSPSWAAFVSALLNPSCEIWV
jgi:hypothetical protein